MEHSQLNYYQAQYQPSFINDQEKIDDFFTFNSSDALNTPNIDLDIFNEKNLFNPVQKVGLKAIVKDPIDDFVFINNIGLGEQQQKPTNPATNAASAHDRSANYSPYSEDKQLESAAININSPEMMPVSPNKVCPQMESMYAIEEDSTVYAQMSEYEKTLAMYEPSTGSSSRSSSISSGSGDNTHSYDYLFNSVDTFNNDPTLMCRVPESPASVASNYSNESTSKTFTNLETASQIQPIQIKQEPIDMYHPTVLEELESTDSFFASQMQPQAMASAYTTLNPTDISSSNQYYYQTVSSLPIPVANIQQQPQQQPAASSFQQHQPSPATSGNRKRNANAAFASASTSGASSSSSTKKPRMTKREKQKMMETDISKYENENRDLRQSIDLLERQIQFCKRFLSENVAPVIQRQQQQQMSQFGSPQMVVGEI